MESCETPRAEISLASARDNFLNIRGRVPAGVKLFCVVKADAYGHGAVPLARLFEELGADGFCVAREEEGERLRRGGIFSPILVLGTVPTERVGEAISNSLTLTVPSLPCAEALSRAARAAGAVVPVHLKVDTGMHRSGLSPDHPEDLAAVLRLPALCFRGIFTHFAHADEGAAGDRETERAFSLFSSYADRAETILGRKLIRHASNSGALLDRPDLACDAVRAGILLFGYPPSDAVRVPLRVTPVMTLKAPVTEIRDLARGERIGYGGAGVLSHASRVATLPVGYADGIPRLCGISSYRVLAGGVLCPVIGRVCMDQMTVDIEDAPVGIGDPVTVFGAPPAPTAADLAKAVGRIPYEILVGIGARVTRTVREIWG